MEEVKFGSKVYTDDAVAYNELRSRFVHEVVNKTEKPAFAVVSTSTEWKTFWSLLKCGLNDTYVAVGDSICLDS